MDIYVVLFKGIPEMAFYEEKGVIAYLRKEGKFLKKVHEDMENNPIPNWEVYTVEGK
jgi:hypothetical protein